MSYYYLKASLPEIQLGAEPGLFDFKSVFSLIETNLKPEDRKVYEAIILQNDNRNFLNILFNEYFELEYENEHRPSYLHIEWLEDYRRHMGELPDYMLAFLKEHSGFFSTYTLTEIELRLRAYFMDYIKSLDSMFLLYYYDWQYQLKELLSEINVGQFPFLKPRGIYDVDYLRPVKAINIQLDKQKIQTDLLPLLTVEDYTGLERQIDEYYWEFAESWPDDFSAYSIWAYVVKLLRIARWAMLFDGEHQDKAAFESLLQGLKDNNSEPKMTVI